MCVCSLCVDYVYGCVLDLRGGWHREGVERKIMEKIYSVEQHAKGIE